MHRIYRVKHVLEHFKLNTDYSISVKVGNNFRKLFWVDEHLIKKKLNLYFQVDLTSLYFNDHGTD